MLEKAVGREKIHIETRSFQSWHEVKSGVISTGMGADECQSTKQIEIEPK